MSTTPTIPAAPPAPAAPAAASTPAPAPATTPAASTPSPTPTPAPVSSTPSGEKTTRERLMEGWGKAKATVPLEEGAAEAPAEEAAPAEAPAAAEAPADTPEAAAEAAVAAEEAPAEAPPAEQPAAAASEPGFELDDTVPLGPQEFAKALDTSPEAKKFFDDHPEIKGQVFSALRRDTETRELREYVPDVATAKVMSTAAATWNRTDNLFLQATTREGATEFLNEWTKMAMITDENNQPVLDANGKYQFHPALLNTFNHVFDNRMSVLRDRAAGMPEEQRERLLAALDIISEVTAPPSQGLDEIPDELKPLAEGLKKERQQLDAEKQAGQKADRERVEANNVQSIERAEKKAEDSVIAQLEPRFKAAGLTEFERKAATRKIGEMLDQKLGSLGFYQTTLDSILMREPGDAREKEHLAHILLYTNQVLGPIVTQVIREAKGGTLTRQQTRQETRTAQEKASATEPKTRSTGPAPVAPITDPKQLITQIRTEWEQAHPGEEMPREYLIKEQMKRSGAFATRK